MKDKMFWAAKGFAIFAGVYFLSAVLVEGILIGAFSLQGYDMLHGEMPEGYIVGLFPLYGFALFAVFSILAGCMVRKKTLADMKIQFGRKTIVQLLAGMVAGAGMVGIIAALLVMIRAYSFKGIHAIQGEVFFVTFVAYLIQGCSEEIMCRGLMQNFFEEKFSRRTAIFLTAVLFMAPHFTTVMDYQGVTMILSIVNLLLVSTLFSMSMICWKSLWVPAGIHVGWNFVLSYICGLELSGDDSMNGILRFAANPGMDMLHGGTYGIEAGIIVTILLVVCDLIIYRWMKEKANE